MARESEQAQARRIVDAIREAGERVVRRVVRNVHDELRENTPRATGYAAENWIPSVGSPARVPVGRTGRAGVGPAKAAAETGRAEVAGYRLVQGVAYIANGVPYVLSLNDGSSAQEPAAFIERAIAEGVSRTRF